MFEERKVSVVCQYDVCETKSRRVAADEADTLSGWVFRKHVVGYGYGFFALTCSAKCRQQWDDEHLDVMRIHGIVDIPLSEGINYWSAFEPQSSMSYFPFDGPVRK